MVAVVVVVLMVVKLGQTNGPLEPPAVMAVAVTVVITQDLPRQREYRLTNGLIQHQEPQILVVAAAVVGGVAHSKLHKVEVQVLLRYKYRTHLALL